MRYILHIGASKTGSKSLQSFLRINRDALDSLGVLYPESYRDGPWHLRVFFEFQEEMIEKLRAESAGYKNSIITYEGGYLAPDETIHRLSRLGDDVNVFAYFRNPVAWINSALNQQFKAHRRTYQNIMEFNVRQNGLLEAHDFNAHINRWERVFGRSNITVMPYRHNAHPAKALLESIGMQPGKNSGLVFPEKNPNKAADLSSLRVLLYIKRTVGNNCMDRLYSAMCVAHRRLSVNWIDTRHTPPPLLLSDDEIAIIEEKLTLPCSQLISRYSLPPDVAVFRKDEYGGAVSEELFDVTEEEQSIGDDILKEADHIDSSKWGVN